MEINKDTQFFIVEKNSLNNENMVHSKCEQLPQCFHFARKKDAEKCKNDMNKQAYKDYVKHGFAPQTLTWKE